MCKAVDKEMRDFDAHLVEKTKNAAAPVLLIMQITVGIITISDRATTGEYEDLGGPALKEAAGKSGLVGPLRSGRARMNLERIQETIAFVFESGLRSYSHDRRNRNRRARRHAGSDSRNHARGTSRLRRNDAQRIDEDHAERNSVAQSRGGRRSLACHRAAGQTKRRGRMSGIRARRNSARGRARATRADFVLTLHETSGTKSPSRNLLQVLCDPLRRCVKNQSRDQR